MAEYVKEHAATLDALSQVAAKLKEQIATDESNLSNYLQKSEAETTYAKTTEVEKKADATALEAYVKTATAETTYAKKTDIASAYKVKGSVDDLSGLEGLNIQANVGNVYNIKAAFTTDETFLEGTGKSYPAGTNVVVVDDEETYKFDALAGITDLSAYETKANVTSGLAGKADKTALESYLGKEEAGTTYVAKTDIATEEEITALVNELFPAE